MTQFKQDKMTEKERLEALLNRQPVDRISFDLMTAAFAAMMTGYSTVDAYADPQKSFLAQSRAREMFGANGCLIYGGAFGAQEFGGVIEMPTSEFAMAVSLVKPAVQTEEDVLNLKVPDVKTAGILPLFMQFSKLEEEHDYRIGCLIGGILTTLGYVTGVETMCRWMLKKPDMVHKLCRVITDFHIAIAEYWVETFGAERLLPINASPSEANQIISPRQFKDFYLPYQKEVNERLMALGVKNIFTHICGEQNLNLPYWSQIPMGDPGIVSIGHEIDIDKAAECFPNDIIQGNVEPAIIQMGTPDEVYELSRACIEKGKKHAAGFILSPGCELPGKAPAYNVWMMRKAIDDFGWY